MRRICFGTLLLIIVDIVKPGVSAVSRANYGEVALFQAPESYDVDYTVLLNDLSRTDKEVSYKVKAKIYVEPVWKNSEVPEVLLKFELVKPQLHARGKHVNADYLLQPSLWDSYAHTTFYALWKNGVIEETHLDPNDLIDVLNFKRSLISLFQFQLVDGEVTETDVSGTCQVLYESSTLNVIRKIKRSCSADGGRAEQVEARTRRVARYSLSAALDALQELHAEEVHELARELGPAALKARVWLRLTRAPPSAAPPAPGGARPALPAGLALAQLPAPPPAADDDDDDAPLSPAQLHAALADSGAALAGGEAGAGGGAEHARALLRLLPALRRASADVLRAAQPGLDDPERLAAWLRALGLAGSTAALAAADALLQLRAPEQAPEPALAAHYFEGFALAPQPQDAAVEEVARLGADERLAEAALLAAAAAAARLPSAAAAPRALRERLARAIERCGADDACRAVRLHALGNMRRADAAELLLSHAERGTGAAALAALGALGALPARELARDTRPRRLAALVLTPRPLELRAAALELMLRAGAEDAAPLLHVLPALRGAPEELRRVCWQALRAAAEGCARLRELLGVLEPDLLGWDEQAIPGTSTALERDAGSAAEAGGWRVRLRSLQLARAGLLRRGLVQLTALAPDNRTDDTLTVELWTRGLEAVAGGEPEPGVEEDAAAGLALSVGGARMRGLTLFHGQGELLAHVWAGAGSEPTPVLRAVRPLRRARGVLPLLGGATLRLERDAALALALDAQAQVSLWSRTARTQLELRAGLAAAAEARVRGAGAELWARGELATEPRLHIAAELDFYDGVALCVRARTDEHTRAYNLSLVARGALRGVRRRRAASWAGAGRTLALGAANDAACRTLTAGD